MRLINFLRARLALRIYLVGIAQFVMFALGFGAIVSLNISKTSNPHEAEIRFVTRVCEIAVNHPEILPDVLETANKDLHATITIFDPDGRVLTSNSNQDSIPQCVPMAPGDHAAPGKPGCRARPILFSNGREGRLEIIDVRPVPPVSGGTVILLILVVVGISSWLLTRSLTRPLGQLSKAAQALGNGDLDARVRLDNRDELGDVSRAFDEMAERVKELLRIERELLANVSHELRTPLSRIRMALALVSEAEGDVAVAREMLGEIGSDLDELERLISDVLTAARLDFEEAGSSRGIPPLRREHVDIADLLEFAVTRFRSNHPNRPLFAEISTAMVAIDVDPVLLRRVFDNLLENAHKYSERPDESIQVSAAMNESIVVDMIDHGIGIAADDLTRVFRPFYRVDKSRTRTTGGLGLGLPLAKRIVEAHGGTIEITSKLGEGTRVRVTLPVPLNHS